MFDTFFFAVFPYLCVGVAVVGGVYRYATDRFSYSSQSSQFLENRALFWGSVTWHYAIIVVLLAHIAALAFRPKGLKSGGRTKLSSPMK